MPGRWQAVWSLSAFSCVAFVSVASAASHPQERQGFWIGLGAGVGFADATCDVCGSGDRQTGLAGYVNLGGTLSERLLVGGHVNAWSKDQGDVTLNLYSAAAALTFYPRASSGFFLKGGVGVSFMDTERRDGSTTITVHQGSGVGLLAGAGYDVRVGRNTSITPMVDFWYGTEGFRLGGDTLDTFLGSFKHNVVALTLGITFH
jgi:hypothetical protein